MSGLELKRLGIDTQQEHIIFMRADCDVCRSEGFEALQRVLVCHNNASLIATINTVQDSLLGIGQAGISESAWTHLGAKEGDRIQVKHTAPVDSFSYVRSKLYGHRLDPAHFSAIIQDIAQGLYSNIQIAAFVSSCLGDRMDLSEITSLTKAMVDVGEKLEWGKEIVADKHCVGGLPGNRSTPIVVGIIAAAGLTIPKTSSRAITSPSGTADTMEVMTTVALSAEKMRAVVEQEGGCLIWGGSVNLSPVDDMIIRVERGLNVDSEGQMIASVLSKKAAAGATHVVLDLPVGATAKVRTQEAAHKLAHQLSSVADVLGLKTRILLTDGTQPIGRGIGPALEARDVLQVLRGSDSAPQDLIDKSVQVAGVLLELTGKAEPGHGESAALALLRTGKALDKFLAICEAQGGFAEPKQAPYTHEICALSSGTVRTIDNRSLSRVAKLAGAPQDRTAGLELFVKIGDQVTEGQPLFKLHSESTGELEYALTYVQSKPHIIEVQP